MKKGDATRERIIREAVEQTSVRGLTAVSLGDVAFAVGLSKSGLFKHFDSKEAMQQAVLEAVLARYREVLWDGAEDMPPGRARLERVFDNWLTWMDNACAKGGCVLIAATIELDDQPGPLRDFLEDRQRRWRVTLIGELQALTEPPLPISVAEQAVFEMKSFILGYNEAFRLLHDVQCGDHARAAFRGLLDRLTI